MTPKHTPTPWKITNSGYDDNLIYKIQIGTNSRTVAYAYSADGDKQDEQVANAVHILKCVNERDQLLITIGKLSSGMKRGDEGWSELDEQSYLAAMEA